MWYIADCIKVCLWFLICTCASYEYCLVVFSQYIYFSYWPFPSSLVYLSVSVHFLIVIETGNIRFLCPIRNGGVAYSNPSFRRLSVCLPSVSPSGGIPPTGAIQSVLILKVKGSAHHQTMHYFCNQVNRTLFYHDYLLRQNGQKLLFFLRVYGCIMVALYNGNTCGMRYHIK